MISKAAILSFLISIPCFANQAEIYSSIAEEMLSAKKYEEAIQRCAKVLSKSPEHKKCSSITEKANQALKANALAQSKKNELKKMKELEAKKRDEELQQEWVAKQERQKVEKEKMLASPEYNMNKVCSCQSAESYLNSRINEEKKVGELSGFVDKNKLHRYGSQIILIQKAQKYYFSKSKNIFEQSKCPEYKNDISIVGECLNGTPGNVIGSPL